MFPEKLFFLFQFRFFYGTLRLLFALPILEKDTSGDVDLHSFFEFSRMRATPFHLDPFGLFFFFFPA